jgi:hypothetical protein
MIYRAANTYLEGLASPEFAGEAGRKLGHQIAKGVSESATPLPERGVVVLAVMTEEEFHVAFTRASE